MFSFLKNHPFPVEAFFNQSVVLTFAVPKENLQTMLPECLTLDTFNDQFGFIAVAMVQTEHLRPKGFPTFLGNCFFLIGYRIFVRYTSTAGKRLRGLYILKSETDKKKMELLGNIFTRYKYTTTDIRQYHIDEVTRIDSAKSGFSVAYDDSEMTVDLPNGSPFANWKEARRYAGPLPYTFTFLFEQKKVLIIEGVRENWEPKPINIISYKFSFLDELDLGSAVLANAFIIRDIPYCWKKGRTERWPW